MTTVASLVKPDNDLPPKVDDHRQYPDRDASKAKKSACISVLDSDDTESSVYIEWEENDPRNPINFSCTRKWIITLTAAVLTGLASSNASTYALGYASMTRDLSCNVFQATLGLSLYALGFAFIPLVSAPLSEEFGRQPLYFLSTLILAAMHLGIALAQNIQSVLIMRFISGAAGSTGATMVGGSIADIWSPQQRGLPMAIFSVAGLAGTGFGPAAAGWIAMNKHLEWRWIQWTHLIVTVAYLAVMTIALTETRSSILLSRIAATKRKDTGQEKYRVRYEEERENIWNLAFISCTRPILFLCTEPVVASFSLWIGFAWGTLYSLIESVAPAFQELHNFNIGEVGTVFLSMSLGSLLGFATNLLQEHLYQENFKARHQEARLYMACFAGILFPVGMLIYAATAVESIHWMGMVLGIVIFSWAIFIIYTAVHTYLADCYGPYASSAIAGQSLFRNLTGFAFPLFTTQMFDRLTFRWSSMIFGGIAVLMAPIPFILFFWGPRIRSQSKIASQIPAFGS